MVKIKPYYLLYRIMVTWKYNLIITYKQAKRFTKNIFDKIPIMKENMWMNIVPKIGLIA